MTTVTLHNDDQGDLYVMAWDFNMTDAQGDPTLVQDRTRLNRDQRLDVRASGGERSRSGMPTSRRTDSGPEQAICFDGRPSPGSRYRTALP